MDLELEQRGGKLFNLILGGHLVYSWVSHEASRSCCCHLLATSKICCISMGLKTKPSAVASLILVLSRTVSDSSVSVADGDLPGFSLQSSSCCHGWTICPCSLLKRLCLVGSLLGQWDPPCPLDYWLVQFIKVHSVMIRLLSSRAPKVPFLA